MKRYSVVYDDLIARWAVVDTKAAGLVIGFHDDEVAAEEAAQREEIVWPERLDQGD